MVLMLEYRYMVLTLYNIEMINKTRLTYFDYLYLIWRKSLHCDNVKVYAVIVTKIKMKSKLNSTTIKIRLSTYSVIKKPHVIN